MAITRSGEAGVRHGAYGFALSGVDDAADLLVEAPTEWTSLRVTRRVGRTAIASDRLGDRRAELKLRDGGSVAIEREPLAAVYTLPQSLVDRSLVHPYLAPVAAVAAHWQGRESFHGGAYVTRDGAWAVIAEREGGKSSMLAGLAASGTPVLCDDLLVVEDGRALAGPRTIDLRAAAAAQLALGEPIGVVGARERWRLRLDPVSPAHALRGWVFLAWGDLAALQPVTATERLQRLAAARAVRVPPDDPSVLLRLAALPGWELRRPRNWHAHAETIALVLSLSAGPSRPTTPGAA